MKNALLGSLVLNVVLVGVVIYFVGAHFNYRQNVQRPDSTYHKIRGEIFQVLPIKDSAIVFVGTSLTEGFPLSEIFPQKIIFNRGIGGTEIQQLVERLDGILKSAPSKVFVEVGTNDILREHPTDSILHDYAILLNKLAPLGRKVYFQSIPPLADNINNFDNKNRQIDIVNERVRKITLTAGMNYIDITTPLRKKGRDVLEWSYTYDGIHLTLKGYLQWIRQITPYL